MSVTISGLKQLNINIKEFTVDMDKAVDDADLLTGLNEDAAEEHKLDRKAFDAVAACDSFQTTAQKPIGENASTELVAVDDVLLPTAEYSCLNPGNNDVVLNGAAWARNLPGNKHLHAVCTSRKAQYIAIHQRDTKSKHNYICATIEFVENNGFRFLQSTPDGFQLGWYVHQPVEYQPTKVSKSTEVVKKSKNRPPS